jgi:hypothetical protein
MSVEKLDNQSDYARTQRRRELFTQMGAFSAGVGSVYQPQANNRYGKKLAAQAQGNPVQSNPFGGLIAVSKNKANPLDKKGNLNAEGLSNGVDLNKLTGDQLKRLEALKTLEAQPTLAPGNDGDVSGGIPATQVHLVGDKADPAIAKTVALTRGIQVTDVQTQVQARLLPPQLQEMIRGLMLPNLPQLTQANSQAADEGFQKWTVSFKDFFEPMGSATQRPGDPQQGFNQQGFHQQGFHQQPSQQGFRFKG